MQNPTQVISEFVGNGMFLIYSLDNLIIKMIEKICEDHKIECKTYSDESDFRTALQIATSKGKQIVAFVEREISGVSNIPLIFDINNFYPKNVKVVVLSYATTEATMAEVLSLNVAKVIIKLFQTPRVEEKVLFEMIVNVMSPDNEFTSKLKEARLHLMDGNFAEVERICSFLLKVKESQAVLMVYAELLERRDDNELAEKYYLRALEYSKTHIQLLEKIYRFYESIGKIEQSLYYLKMLDSLCPANSKRKKKLASLCSMLMNKEDALMYAKQAEEFSVKESVAEHKATVISLATSLLPVAPDRAREMLSTVLSEKKEDDIDDFDLLETMARLLNRQARHDEALDYYKRAYNLNPTALVTFNMGICYLQKNDVESSSNTMKDLLDKYPDFVLNDPLKSPHLAYIFKLAGEVELMEQFKAIAIATCPNHPLVAHLK